MQKKRISTFNNSSSWSRSQMTLPTFRNSRLGVEKSSKKSHNKIKSTIQLDPVGSFVKIPEALSVRILWLKEHKCQRDLKGELNKSLTRRRFCKTLPKAREMSVFANETAKPTRNKLSLSLDQTITTFGQTFTCHISLGQHQQHQQKQQCQQVLRWHFQRLESHQSSLNNTHESITY